MTEYKIACNSGIGDTLTVRGAGEEVGFVAAAIGERFRNSVYVSASDARTFARGVLALADEVDGGEAKEADTRPKVGDRLRVTVDAPRCAPVTTGDIITVTDVGYDGNGEHCVRFLADGDGPDAYRWFVPLTAVEPVTEKPVATVKIGDRVTIIRPESCLPEYEGVAGTLTDTDNTACKYRVRAVDDTIVWAYEVKPVTSTEPLADGERDLLADEPTAATPAPSRLALLEQARGFLTGQSYSAHDLLRVADYLAGESA